MPNINRQKLIYDVENILYQAHYMSGRRRVAKEIVNTIMDYVDGEIMKANKDWNLYHDFPQHLEPLVRRIEKGLHFELFPRTDEAAKVYEWILEQEREGRKLETWIAWANNPERQKYAGKYKARPLNIQADYPQAFITIGRQTEII
jgi:hypothetical protein